MKLINSTRGLILPSVLIVSLAAIAMMITLLAVTSSAYRGGYVDHYQKLADEAAEAGSAYATACLNLSSHVQTWGSAVGRSNLSPNTDCDGNNSYASNQYVFSNSSYRTYFTVGNLDYSEQFAAQVSAQGFTEVLRADGSVEKTFTSIQKKVLTWPTDIVGQKSSSGPKRTCAIVNYKVYCWGINGYGQLGDGRYLGTGSIENASIIDSVIPVKVRQDPGVLAGKNIEKMFIAQWHTCVLSTDGLMYCWGRNNFGQLGDGTTTDSPVAIQVGGALAGKVITDIGGTRDVSCAIAEGKIYCWGSNSSGTTGRNTASGNTTTPSLVTAGNTSSTLPTNYTATALSTSGSRSWLMCAIAGGKAYCWGQNTIGSVGDNTTTQRNLPTKVFDGGVLAGRTVTAISQDGYYSDPSGGYAHVCVIASGAVFCWGENGSGQLGNNSTTDSRVPVAVSASGVLNGKTIQEIAVGVQHSCVRADNGAYCWGTNYDGQVGDGVNGYKTTPAAVAQLPGGLTSSNVTSIGAGSNRGCAVITDGRSFCWGSNQFGQIGDGTLETRYVPTESLFLRPVGNQYIF